MMYWVRDPPFNGQLGLDLQMQIHSFYSSLFIGGGTITSNLLN